MDDSRSSFKAAQDISSFDIEIDIVDSEDMFIEKRVEYTKDLF